MSESERSDRRASAEQVLAGLNLAYQRLSDRSVEPLRPEDSFRKFVEADEEFCPLVIGEVFSIHFLSLKLEGLFAEAIKQGPEAIRMRFETLTISDVIEHLRPIVPPTSLEPIEIAGVHCGKAAAFLALRELIPRWKWRWIAPSQRVSDCLSTMQIRSLCESLKWVAPERRLACSRWCPKRWQTASSLRACSWLTLGIAAVIAFGGIPEVGAIFLLFTGLLRGIAAMAIQDLSPLPDGVVTFRDLATAIAQ